MNRRHTIPADEFCISVRDGTHDSPQPVPRGRHLVTSRHIIGGRLNLAAAYSISEADYVAINARSKVDRWDVLISMIGTVGEPCLVRTDPDFAIKNVGLFKSKGEIEGKWLYLYLRSPFAQQLIRERLSGTTQAYIPLGTLRKFPIVVPSTQAEMKDIVTILSSLDDKIDLNRRMNETLEAMARAIFKDWFVDFGPVRAKAEGHQPPGLAADIAALFPDKLDDDDKPVGWRAGRLGDIAMTAGLSVQPDGLSPETPYIGLEHMPRRSIALDSWEGAGKVTSGKLSFRCGDFLFGKLRPYFHKVGIAPIDGICSTDIVVMKAKELDASAFVLACISCDEFVAYTDQGSSGTKMPRTSWALMAQYELTIPPDSLLSAFQETAWPLFERIVANIHENRTLAVLRDLLLPKLMSGEVRLKDSGSVTPGAV